MAQIEVIVNGARGRMGQEVVRAVEETEDLLLIAQTDLGDDFEGTLRECPGAVVVDFTHPSCALANATAILDAGCYGVIGTTGFTPDQLEQLSVKAQQARLGMIIAPNFAIGAVLMMHLAAEAATWMDTCEIIEIHHPGKADAPSGTAEKSALMIAETRRQAGQPPFPAHPPARETIAGCRGGEVDGIRIHSLRTLGTIANQEIVFGALGQTLTIRHDTTSRTCFMPGVIMACRRVVELEELVYGLDHLLFG